MTAPVPTTVEALRSALAQTIACSAQELQDAIGQVVVVMADAVPQLLNSGVPERSVYDADTRTMALLADRIPAGLEAQAISDEMVRHHGRRVAEVVLGKLPEPKVLEAGDKVFVLSEQRLATVLNVYGDGLKGSGGEVRVDLCGNTPIQNLEPYDPALHASYDDTFVPIKAEWKKNYGITQDVPLRKEEEEFGIQAVLTRQEGESIALFKQRCGDAMGHFADNSPVRRGFVGRYTALPDGRLKNDSAWGQGWLNELPAETCVIVSHSGIDQSGFIPYTQEQLAAAPLNPGLVFSKDSDPLIKVRLRDSESQDEEVEFNASDVLKHNGENRSWAELGRDPLHQHAQMSMAEDYALYAFKRKFGDMEAYEATVLEGLDGPNADVKNDLAPAVVEAAQFHSMRGHVAEGTQVRFGSGEVLTVRSALKGWNLESEDGKVALGPFDGAMALTAAVVQRDAASERTQERDSSPSPGF